MRGDAFGRALWDHLHGSASTVIVERDDGFIDADFPVAAYLAPFARWPAHERKAMRLARGRVLDVGCGAGRHALYLQERGHRVVGIDVSPLAVRVCRARGLRDARVLSVTQTHRLPGTFQTVVMMGNNLGLLGNPARARWILRRMPAGRIIGQTLDPYQTDIPEHLAYHRRNRSRGRMSGEIRLRLRYKDLATPWFDYLFMSRDELERIVEGTGWRVERYLDSGGPVYVAVLTRESM